MLTPKNGRLEGWREHITTEDSKLDRPVSASRCWTCNAAWIGVNGRKPTNQGGIGDVILETNICEHCVINRCRRSVWEGGRARGKKGVVLAKWRRLEYGMYHIVEMKKTNVVLPHHDHRPRLKKIA